MPRGYKNSVPAPKATSRRAAVALPGHPVAERERRQPENTGLAVDYYLCPVNNPHRAEESYIAECGDIIESLNMTFNEASAFKAIWRKAAERTLGLQKAGNDAKRDAEKMLFYGKRELSVVTGKKVL